MCAALSDPTLYIEPLLCPAGPDAPPGAQALAGGWARFDRVRRRPAGARGDTAWGPPEPAAALPPALTTPRPALLGLPLDRPRIMAVLNVTPDSFSDGGRHLDPGRAVAAGLEMVEAGADILDIGGESTRPGAEPADAADERARVLPVIRGLAAAGPPAPLSIDTRKASVAREAFAAGARLFNDVSALCHDPEAAAAAAELCAAAVGGWVCLVHSQGDPRVMQQAPRYDDVVLDVYDGLAALQARAVSAGVPEDRILLDPGIGFGKTAEHNLALLRRLALFHGLGAPILLGASRKRFIGLYSGEPQADRRAPGSVAAALWGAARGAQVIRVHDVRETVQAVAMLQAMADGPPT